MQSSKKLKVVGVRLTEEEHEQLREYAEDRGRTMSQELRLQIKTMLNTKKLESE